MRNHPRCRVVVFVLCLLLLPSPLPAAAERGVLEGMGHKLLRGAVNITTGCAEIVKQPWLLAQEEGWGTALLRGPFDGLGLCVIRTFGGMYEVLTFPFPLPPGYVPLVEPDYVWQEEPGRGGPAAQAGDAP